MNTINNTIFKALAKNVCPEDSNLECVALKSTYDGFEMNIYAWENEGYQLQIQDFGYYQGKQWVACTPTLEQKGYMNMLLSNEIQRLEKIEEQNTQNAIRHQQFKADCYKYNEVGF